jgi:hypothetical protein
VLGALIPAHAQDTESDFQIWTPVTLKAELPYKFQGSLEVQTRFGDNASQLSTLILRPSLGYDFNRHVSVEMGYQDENKYANGKTTHEQRIYQELWLRKSFGRHNLSLRSRLEEFFEVDGKIPLRMRFRLTNIRPIGASHWHIVTENELFVSLNTIANERNAGFNQNRLFVGVGRDFLKNHLRVQAGYLLRYVDKPSPDPNQIDHVLMFRTSYHLQGRGRRLVGKHLDQ